MMHAARIQAGVSYPDGTSHFECTDKEGCVSSSFWDSQVVRRLTAVTIYNRRKNGLGEPTNSTLLPLKSHKPLEYSRDTCHHAIHPSPKQSQHHFLFIHCPCMQFLSCPENMECGIRLEALYTLELEGQ